MENQIERTWNMKWKGFLWAFGKNCQDNLEIYFKCPTLQCYKEAETTMLCANCPYKSLMQPPVSISLSMFFSSWFSITGLTLIIFRPLTQAIFLDVFMSSSRSTAIGPLYGFHTPGVGSRVFGLRAFEPILFGLGQRRVEEELDMQSS